ncbi:glycosyltransferase family 4 protein [Alienimonas californiensis]|uniref:Glycosyltransferase subfamily 4-like N-terminal domain-containing protein n=1 Tax=Alienimonas californiensis TaxID=2527989 RepID=A0A517P7Y7_9PLAN|nr:glycosyltransferase family 4 protein [Alienimonas californiensis]QDT15487.1 hypothetical protein CA12_15720 [Alienimonas californiensis]
MLDFLSVNYELPPGPAGAIQAGRALTALRDRGWRFEALTATPDVELPGVRTHHVPDPGPSRLARRVERSPLRALAPWLIRPDRSVSWVEPALARARALVAERRPRFLVGYVMPYAAGLVGVRLAEETGLPLVIVLGDSPTCGDMHPVYPSRGHLRELRELEDRFVRQAAAVAYVSQVNADRVRDRQPEALRNRVHVVRRAASPAFRPASDPPVGEKTPVPDRVVIRYLGALGGWHHWWQRRPRLTRLRRAVEGLGSYRAASLDYRTHSPVHLGMAVRALTAERPEWAGRVTVQTFGGNAASPEIIRQVLRTAGVEDAVEVHPGVPAAEVGALAAGADLLFLCLPQRRDGGAGGIISAKTYEYLATDRPILAAVPRGENWNYLEGRPGVWLTEPDDVAGMQAAVEAVCEAKLTAGAPLRFDRSVLWPELSPEGRAGELAALFEQVCPGGPIARAAERPAATASPA